MKWDIDFRGVYARILDNWLGSDSVAVLDAGRGELVVDVRGKPRRAEVKKKPLYTKESQ